MDANSATAIADGMVVLCAPTLVETKSREQGAPLGWAGLL